MKSIVLLSLVAFAAALPTEQIINPNYHEDIGIPAAARIKAGEGALDFDGSRIVGGSNANLGQYPYFGGLVITLTGSRTSVCGSSMLTNNRAVTAAHCWWDGANQAIQFTVVLGSVTLFSGGTRINTNQVVMHNQWTPSAIRNDVAVIRLNWVNFSNTINRINLATGSNNFAGTWAQACGFGAQADGVGISTAQRLHHVTLQVITNAACQAFFGGHIVDSTLCINGANRQSTCGGDSGGPLATGSTLIGITSFGYAGGCQRGWPAAFARVTSFASWIQSQL